MEWEKRKLFVYMATSAYQVMLKKVEIVSLDTIAFFDTYVYIKNPYWQSSRIIITLWKYYIVISDTLLGCHW